MSLIKTLLTKEEAIQRCRQLYPHRTLEFIQDRLRGEWDHITLKEICDVLYPVTHDALRHLPVGRFIGTFPIDTDAVYCIVWKEPDKKQYSFYELSAYDEVFFQSHTMNVVRGIFGNENS